MWAYAWDNTCFLELLHCKNEYFLFMCLRDFHEHAQICELEAIFFLLLLLKVLSRLLFLHSLPYPAL